MLCDVAAETENREPAANGARTGVAAGRLTIFPVPTKVAAGRSG